MNRPLWISAIAFLVFTFYVRHAESDMCTTDACHDAADMLRKSMNLSADPCNDFYNYACGNWIRDNPIPPTDSRRSQFHIVSENLTQTVLEILTAPYNTSEPRPLRIAKTFFKSCIDTEKMDNRGLEPLKDLIKMYGGWPLANIQGSTKQTVQAILGTLIRDLDTSALLSVTNDLDMKNTSRRVITIDQPSFFLARDFLVDTKSYENRIAAYKNLLQDVALHLQPNLSTKVLTEKIEKLLEFEIKLATAASSEEHRRNVTALYNLFSLDTFQEFVDAEAVKADFAEIKFHELLSKIWEGVTNVSENEGVVVYEPQYLKHLRKIMDVTSEETILNYIQWRWIATLLEDTTNKMRELSFDFEKVIRGVQEPENRTKLCGEMDGSFYSMGYAIAGEYIEKYFPPSDKQVVDELVEYLQDAFAQLLNDAEWMDRETKKKAKEKLDHISRYLAYPDWLTNATAIEEYFKELDVRDGEHLENYVNFMKWESLKQIRKLREDVNRNVSDFHPLFVNAFYSPLHNSINFPAAILTPPFFRAHGISPLNFGAIGVVIGHEITHGFDDEGSNYDIDGNIRNWWDEDTRTKFEKKAQCLMKQYSGFRTPYGNVNGRLTCGENIADNGGLRQAYASHKKWLVDKGTDAVVLPGFENFTPDQLFFLGFATVWCYNASPQIAQQSLLVDPHSPANYRVLGSVQNSEPFAKTWNCSRQSAMNPVDKCVLW